MTQGPKSPSPSEVGFAISRRNLVGGAVGAAGLAAVLAACGSDDKTEPAASDAPKATDAPKASEAPAASEPAASEPAATSAPTEAPPAGGGAVTFGSNYSDEKPKAAIAAAVEAAGGATINTVDHNTYQQNFNTYIQQPDDVVCWFAGYRMRAFAAKGVVGDLSDVWGGFTDMSDGFKNASTALDGKQYFVPFYFYPWAIHYKGSLFKAKGYEIPKTWDDLLKLCEKMKADGITPFAAANDGKWPQMGMFDMINMRTNGYDFHVSLMGGKESWTDPKVKKVFENWKTVLPYYQDGVNGRKWEDGAASWGKGEVGMYLIGTFLASQFTEQADLDDIEFFPFPEIDPANAQDAVEAPIDGFMMAKAPKDEAGAKKLLAGLGGSAAIDAYLGVDPSVVAANAKANTSGYNKLQKASAELVGKAKYISQFLDRDTDPDFAANVVGAAIADFLSDPSKIDDILKGVEEQKATYTFE